MWIDYTQFIGYSVMFSSENRVQYTESELFIYSIVTWKQLSQFKYNNRKQ